MITPMLSKRQYYGNNDNCYENEYGNVTCNGGAWETWVRWLVLGLIILGAFLLFFLFSCITARRRRRAGYAPYRGTGWSLGRTPPGHAPATYNAQPYYGDSTAPQQEQPYYNNSNNPAPPAYAPPPNANNWNNNDYYRNDNDVELQQNGYNAGQSAYEPPKSPPPAHSKNDGIIR